MSFKIRAHVSSEILRAFINVINAELQKPGFVYYAEGVLPSCINCLHFDHREEICVKYKARPPARVIALSCNDWLDCDDIPF